jgi:hypothetical protein
MVPVSAAAYNDTLFLATTNIIAHGIDKHMRLLLILHSPSLRQKADKAFAVGSGMGMSGCFIMRLLIVGALA